MSSLQGCKSPCKVAPQLRTLVLVPQCLLMVPSKAGMLLRGAAKHHFFSGRQLLQKP
jgi:hypothetical protein